MQIGHAHQELARALVDSNPPVWLVWLFDDLDFTHATRKHSTCPRSRPWCRQASAGQIKCARKRVGPREAIFVAGVRSSHRPPSRHFWEGSLAQKVESPNRGYPYLTRSRYPYL